MPNSFYYTMATVAGSLGSAMALLAAFALYRLTAIAGEMQFDSLRIAEGMGGEDRGPMLFSASIGDWPRYLALMDRAHGRYSNPERDIDITVQALMVRLPANLRRSRMLFASLWIALALTAIVMTGAVTALAAADRLQCFASTAPWAAVAGFVACLISYLVLIWLAQRRVALRRCSLPGRRRCEGRSRLTGPSLTGGQGGVFSSVMMCSPPSCNYS